MSLHVVTLHAGPPTRAVLTVLQQLAADPPPTLPGLRARHWRADRRAVVGHYVVDDPACDVTADPALARLPATERLAIAAIPDVDLDRPVFIISAPRAGSTLLFETLQRARGVWTIDGESHGVIEGVPALHLARRGHASDRLDERDADPATIAAVRAGFIAALRDHRGQRYLELADRPRQVRLVEKTPENALRIAFLRAVFPDARFILLHRDPRQNVSSIIDAWRHDGFVRFSDLPGWARRRWCCLLPPDWQALADASLSDIAARQWRAAYEHALDDLAAVPRDRWTSVELSDLVAAPDRVVRRLCAFMDVEVDPELAAVIARPLPLSSTTLTAPSPIKWRSNGELRAGSLVPLGPLGGRLRDLSALAPATPGSAPVSHTAPNPRVRFACELADAEPAVPSPAHVVHPALQVQRGAVPLAIVRRAPHRDRFVDDRPIAWIEDSATGVLQPFWIARAHVAELARLVPGRAAPQLPPELAAKLAGAGILVDPAELARRRAYGDTLVADAGFALARDRFCHLPGLLDLHHVAALARYNRELVDSGAWTLGDAQVARRHGWHNELVARFYQIQVAGYVARVAGESIKPAYCYTSAYTAGAALTAHADRKQCELTVSVMIDEQPGGEPWPLWFQAPDGKRSVTLALGDAVLFRGCELPHWREAAPPGQHSTMLLFHYVPSTFTGPLD